MARILIVESDGAIEELYRYIFCDLGHKVDIAKDAAEGIEIVYNTVPDCILLDISMPEMTVAEFAGKLCSSPDPAVRDIPYLVLTDENYAGEPGQYGFLENCRCKAFLPKVASPDSVVEKVQSIVGRRPG